MKRARDWDNDDNEFYYSPPRKKRIIAKVPESFIIYYQSLNSNASIGENRDVGSTAFQHITKLSDKKQIALQKTRVKSNISSGFLDYPFSDGITHEPVLGPPRLVSYASESITESFIEDTSNFLAMTATKMHQLKQAIHREMGGTCDYFAFGEVDSEMLQWKNIFEQNLGTNIINKSIQYDKNKLCQSFSLHSFKNHTPNVCFADEGYLAVRHEVIRFIRGVSTPYSFTVVYVHVPNEAIKGKNEVEFYKGIKDKVGNVDIFMGDTNQTSAGSSQKNINAAFGSANYREIFSDSESTRFITPADTFNIQTKGTNSGFTKYFDVIVYNQSTVQILRHSFFSQNSFTLDHSVSRAITDHMGVAVKFSLKNESPCIALDIY